MLGRRAVAAAVIAGAAAFSGGAVAATHSAHHQTAKPKPAHHAPRVNHVLGEHHCHFSSDAGISGSV